LGWEKGEKEIKLTSLSSDRINCSSLKSVELINGEAGKYLTLNFKQNDGGLLINLPERSFEELAYVLKLSFNGKIPKLDKYADLDITPHYYFSPGDNTGSLILGSDLALTGKRKNISNQWKMESVGKGLYKILNRENHKVFECKDQMLVTADFSGKDNQLWKIQNWYYGLYTISNWQFPNLMLSINADLKEGTKAGLLNSESGSFYGWKVYEVCEVKAEAFKQNNIPGTIEAEDFNKGCPGDAYYDRNEINEGGQYRTSEGVDIEKCSVGGYNVGWTHTGDWMTYSITVNKSAVYQISFFIASAYDSGKLHLECDGEDKTGIISIPNTAGFQNWAVIKKTIKLDEGEHLFKVVVDGDFFNLDKMIFEDIK
jgi:hypothetical protein